MKNISRTNKLVTYVYMLITIFISMFPITWIFISSLKADPLKNPGISLPTDLCLEGYIDVFTKLHVFNYFWNSFKVVSLSVIISITMISMSSYVLARMNFKGKKIVTAMLYSTLFIPATAMTFPVYRLVNKLGIYNTPLALIFVYSCSGIAMSFLSSKTILRLSHANLKKQQKLMVRPMLRRSGG